MSSIEFVIAPGRSQSVGEEVANAVSHGIATAILLAALPMLLTSAAQHSTRSLVTAWVFAASALFMYVSSTLYHALASNRAKRVFRMLDHSAIYLLIAGTYTPFTLGVLRGPMGWTMFGLIWALAIAGILMKATIGYKHPKLSAALYLAMGWLALIAIKSLWQLVPPWGLMWLFGGGMAYTIGIKFFMTDYHPYRHFIWHLFVMAGTACHFMAVWKYSA